MKKIIALSTLSQLGLIFITIGLGLPLLGELDMKKIIALSTLSQLGLIFITIGLGLPLHKDDIQKLLSHPYCLQRLSNHLKKQL